MILPFLRTAPLPYPNSPELGLARVAVDRSPALRVGRRGEGGQNGVEIPACAGMTGFLPVPLPVLLPVLVHWYSVPQGDATRMQRIGLRLLAYALV